MDPNKNSPNKNNKNGKNNKNFKGVLTLVVWAVVLTVALPLLTIMKVMGIELGFNFFIIFLAAFMLLQLIAGFVFFSRLSKKYY